VVTTRHDERGFSMIELMIAMFVSLVVLGSAASIIAAVQGTYRHQLDDVSVEQEGRFAMDFIRRTIEQAGSNPYDVSISACPSADTPVQAITMNPDGDGLPDDIRVQADVGIPDGLIVGDAGNCTQADEDVTIALNPTAPDASRPLLKNITRYDRGTDAAPVAWTDGVFTGLQFRYFTSDMVETAVPGAVRVVRVTITGQSRGSNEEGQFATFELQSDVRLKSQ
jgi:prepilin-type N-terminal cleavage/methylation domain-containing protein